MKRVRSYLVSLLSCYLATTSILLLLSSHFPPTAYAQVPQPWSQVESRPGRCVQQITVGGQTIEVATIQGFECLFTNIVRILVPIAGLALFLMLIVGSFQLITAGGEPKSMQKARQTLTYAIAGLVVFLGIWFILRLIQTITGVDVTRFEIPGPL